MGLIKEYIDRATQTDADVVPSPYADPAVVLAAPPVTRRALHEASHNSIQAPSSASSDGAYTIPPSPTSPMFSALISRRLSRRNHGRHPGEMANRRIVSMPENKTDSSPLLSHTHGKRVVSMPDRVRPELEPSVELFQSPSTFAGDSCGGRQRVRTFRAPSDIPQTPSPPSSPESLLIIAAGTQLPDGFLRRKYSPEPLIEEDEDWITWANSPPRPIPALHGPLSLPYARCPSGAEGTIIEEPDSVAQMIWGLGPDDQPHNQHRAEGLSHGDSHQNAPSHGSVQVPPRLHKKRAVQTHQVPKSSKQMSTHMGHAKPNLSRAQRQTLGDKQNSQSQAPPDFETHQETVNGLLWNDGQSMSTSVGVSDSPSDGTDMLPGVLEWQFTRLRQALRNSLVDIDSYSSYPGRLEPVIPAAVTPGLSQSYPRIFVEPRPNESMNASTRQPPIEIAQQYRQQQLYRQALQKQKSQVQSFLPTPPNSSSPQWSSRFSPYLTYCSTLSPDLVGSTEHPVSVHSQKYRSGATGVQYLRHVSGQHEHDDIGDFDTSTNTSSTKNPQSISNVGPAAPLRQSSSSSSTLAKYIRQLQALSPIAHLSPLQSVPLTDAHSPPLSSPDENTVGRFRSNYQSPVVPTPPSPESPRTMSQRPSYHIARSIPPTRLLQRRLSSVPEEDGSALEFSTSMSPSRLPNHVRTDSIPPGHNGTAGHRTRYLEVPCVDAMLKFTPPDGPELEGDPGTPPITFHHQTSPVKVRLPVAVTKDNNIREQTNDYHEQNKGHQHGHRKKHRFKKLKGLTSTSQQPPRGLVG